MALATVLRAEARIDEAPISFFDPPGDEHNGQGRDRESGGARSPQPDEKVEHQAPAHQTERQITGHDPPIVPLVDRLQGCVDHPGAINRRRGERRREDAAEADKSSGRAEKHPTNAENRERHKGQHGKHPLARQPGRTPLREGAKGALRPAEVKCRADQPGDGEPHSDCEPGKCEAGARRQQSQRRAEPEQQQQRKAGARRRRKQDNR